MVDSVSLLSHFMWRFTRRRKLLGGPQPTWVNRRGRGETRIKEKEGGRQVSHSAGSQMRHTAVQEKSKETKGKKRIRYLQHQHHLWRFCSL